MMIRSKQSVLLLLIAGFLCLVWTATSWAWLEVQTTKLEAGKMVIHYTKNPVSEVAPGSVKRYNPNFSFYVNSNGDNYNDVLTCGENQKTGQVSCQIQDVHGKAPLCAFDLLTPGYDAGGSIQEQWFTGSQTFFVGCGVRLSDNALECQYFDRATCTLQGQFVAVPAGSDPYVGFNSYMGYGFDTDNDSTTPEFGFTYVDAATQQTYFRLVNPFTNRALVSIKILDPTYERWLYPNSTDMDGNNREELTTCARNRLSGQFVCEVRRLNNGGLIRTIPFLGPQYHVDDWSWNYYDNNSNTQEMIVCGWHLDSKQLRCQVKDYTGKVYANFYPLGDDYVP